MPIIFSLAQIFTFSQGSIIRFINSVSPKSDLFLNSLYSNSAESFITIVKIKEKLGLFNKFSLSVLKEMYKEDLIVGLKAS